MNDRFAGPWFDSKTAAVYVCCKNVRAFYAWRKRHGIIARSNGSVCKADLDKALKITRPTSRGRSPASLANLRAPRRERNRTPALDGAKGRGPMFVARDGRI